MKYLAIVGIAAVLCITGCVTPPPPLPEAKPNSLDSATALIDKDPSLAAEQFVKFLDWFPERTTEVGEFSVKLEKAYRESFRVALEKRDYPRSRELLRSWSRLVSAKAVPETEFPELHTDSETLYVLEAEAALKAGQAPRALLLLKDAWKGSPAFLEKTREFFAGSSEENQSFWKSAEPVFEKNSGRPTIVSPDSLDFAKYLKGTVTIIVDRGIKIQNGLGTVDKVIGSGFFIDATGYILTNYHVISSEVDPEYEGYSKLEIRLSTSKDEKISAKVIGWDRLLDLALLKVPIKPEYWFPVTGTGTANPGSKVYSIGSPIGLMSTVSAGIISAIERNILQVGNAMQIDVPVNPGNSGGPLLAENGVLSGIVFAGIPQFQGLNFAVPEALIADSISPMLLGGERKRAWTGLVGSPKGDFLMVLLAIPGSPAWRAGIQEGDLLLSINGGAVKTPAEAQVTMNSCLVGEITILEIERKGNRLIKIVRADERPYMAMQNLVKSLSFKTLLTPLLGMRLTAVNMAQFEPSYIVQEVLSGSIADEVGISENDPIILKDARYIKESKAVLFNIFVKKKRMGFLESIIQIPASIETDTVF